MPDDLIATLGRLKQTDEVWEGTARLARMWNAPKHGPPYRPSLVLFADGQGCLPASKLFDDPPTADRIWQVLAQAMRRPMPGGRPRRPKMTYFDRAEHVQALTARLDAIGVRCEFRPRLPTLEAALSDMEQMLNQDETPLPGLLSLPGLTPPPASVFNPAEPAEGETAHAPTQINPLPENPAEQRSQ